VPLIGQDKLKAVRKSEARSLYHHVRRLIQSGKLKPGDRLRPSRELQREFRISYGATLASLRRLQREGFVVCRPGAGTYVSEAASGVVGRANPKRVQILNSVASANGLFYRPLLDALREQLGALGAEAEIVDDPDRSATWEAPVEPGTDVRIWIRPPLMEPERPSGGVATVMVSHDIEYVSSRSDGYDIVGVDYEQGGAVAAEYLRKIGCRDVAVLAVRSHERPDRPGPIGARRIHGFECTWGERLRGPILLTRAAAASEGAQKVAEFLALDPLPEAVFAICDAIASGFCHGLIAHGLQPGRDVKVVGFNAQPPIYEEDPPLTSVRVPMDELGRAAALMAMERADRPRKPAQRLLLACTLSKGETA